MRKIQEILRLRYALGLGQRQIARSCSIAQATVHEYLKRAQAAGITWPLPEGWEICKMRVNTSLLHLIPIRKLLECTDYKALMVCIVACCLVDLP